MADIIIKIITPATNFALLTLEEIKTLLGVATGDTSSDEQLMQLIDWYSAYVSQIANRVFAKEKLSETWYDLQDRRVFLSHYPVKEADVHSVETPRGTVLDPSGYELEEGSGKIRFKSVPVNQPIVVTYTGGYVLPDECPDDLKSACSILVRKGRTEAQREATAGIRSISHKDQRVMFFDPNAGSGGGSSSSSGGGVTTEAIRAVHALLYHYMRLQV